jgi:hypothetical protein
MITIGAMAGNIIAAIITTQTPTNHPAVPRSVAGPASMPCIRSPVTPQATAAPTSSSPIRPSCRRIVNVGTLGSAVDSIGPCDEAIVTVDLESGGAPGPVRRPIAARLRARIACRRP